ncbi:MAG: aminotransferase class I/II-fold pyridoxal phosphate-dependent enzyme, partial [Bdellovibrionota bacterium]
LYSRHSNPTVDMFSQKLAALEGMEAAVGVASGMAAINCTIRQAMPQGGHIIASKTIYGGTYALMKNILPQSGITVTFVDTNDLKAVEAAVTQNTKMIYAETMSNPMLRIADLPSLKKICVKRGLKLVVDNTFTPLIVRPAQFGADIVVYSCTKYISGASDMMAGAVVASREFINQLIDINFGMIMLTGPAMDPRVAHELYLRMDHLPVRMAAHSKAAAYFVNRIVEEKIPMSYPGLKDHPDHKVFSEMMNAEFGFGGMVVLDCKTVERAARLAKTLQDEKFGLYAVSLGFSRTLISCPAVSTSSEIPVNEQESMGLSPGLLRLSIGFTGNDQIMADRFLKCY